MGGGGVTHERISADEGGMRVDRWFRARFPALSHGQLQKLLRKGQIRLDGARVKANARVEAGQTVRIPPLGPARPGACRTQPPLNREDRAFAQSLVVFRDGDILILNKPAGLAVQGGTGTRRHLDGMLDALKFKAPERPRLVHRLDRDTSGLLVLARNRKAAQFLARAFTTRTVSKTYWALVSGVPAPERGIIDLALKKSGSGRQRVEPAGDDEDEVRRATTRYRVLDRAAASAAWLALFPETGRTHQLRVHLSAIGHPVLGDRKYGDATMIKVDGTASRLHLHAQGLILPRPAGKSLEIEARLPGPLLGSWRFFGFDPATAPPLRDMWEPPA